ncbi:RILP-like protein 1 isoform X2 [Girardinichthys multiradiatus]|uniref:RILP-like protein 1 isoform X2 n=1 Tax=Girardinichthys multiradiatus TaxID=208333 RepID=UPI001FAE6788|nr:RILP-like protein 1 isoform X2 [Girardinichthys multiradiatus]
MSALDRPAAELTVMDVYDIAAVLGQEFERVIDRFGCECLVGVVPRVVQVLEFLEVLVGRGTAGQETEELRGELDRLRRERSDRYEQEKKHQKELEQVEDVWRGEVQDLLSQITQLQAENKRLSVNLSLKESPITEEDPQEHEGKSEKENQLVQKLNDLVDRQRDEIRAKNHKLMLKNEDVEALQLQQHRLIRINQDLLHRTGVMEAQGKTLIQQKAELEAASQAQQQEYAALQLEVRRLRQELQEKELERELAEIESPGGARSGTSLPTSAPMTTAETSLSDSFKPRSVWVECGGDPGFMAKCLECDKSLSLLTTSANRKNEGGLTEEENITSHLLVQSVYAESEDETDSSEQKADKPRFTLQELRDVLHERNELKAQVFMLQEELEYYKSEDFEADISPTVSVSDTASHTTADDQSESGIRRLSPDRIFTAIMPMVAAGLITDDPTMLPIRRLISFV